MPGPRLSRWLEPYSYDSFYELWHWCSHMVLSKMMVVLSYAQLLHDLLLEAGDPELEVVQHLREDSNQLLEQSIHFERQVVRSFFWPWQSEEQLISEQSGAINAARWEPFTPEIWDQLFENVRPVYTEQATAIVDLTRRISTQFDALEPEAAGVGIDVLRWQEVSQATLTAIESLPHLLEEDELETHLKEPPDER